MPSLKQLGEMLNLSGQARLQRLWLVCPSGASSAMQGLGTCPSSSRSGPLHHLCSAEDKTAETEAEESKESEHDTALVFLTKPLL